MPSAIPVSDRPESALTCVASICLCRCASASVSRGGLTVVDLPLGVCVPCACVVLAFLCVVVLFPPVRLASVCWLSALGEGSAIEPRCHLPVACACRLLHWPKDSLTAHADCGRGAVGEEQKEEHTQKYKKEH